MGIVSTFHYQEAFLSYGIDLEFQNSIQTSYGLSIENIVEVRKFAPSFSACSPRALPFSSFSWRPCGQILQNIQQIRRIRYVQDCRGLPLVFSNHLDGKKGEVAELSEGVMSFVSRIVFNSVDELHEDVARGQNLCFSRGLHPGKRRVELVEKELSPFVPGRKVFLLAPCR